MERGWRRSDIGRGLSWWEFKAFVENLPPTGQSAYFRSLKPRSWWVTPEYVALKQNTFAVELGNWQRSGGKAGDKPKPPKFPEDRDMNVSREEIAEKRKAQSKHLAAARAARGRRRKTAKRINPGMEVSRGN